MKNSISAIISAQLNVATDKHLLCAVVRLVQNQRSRVKKVLPVSAVLLCCSAATPRWGRNVSGNQPNWLHEIVTHVCGTIWSQHTDAHTRKITTKALFIYTDRKWGEQTVVGRIKNKNHTG